MDILEHRYWCCRSLFGKFIVKVMTYCCSIEIHIFLFHLFHNFFFTVNLFAFVSLYMYSWFCFINIFTFFFSLRLHILSSIQSSHFCFTGIFMILFHKYLPFFFLAHLAKGNMSYWHPSLSSVCKLFTF